MCSSCRSLQELSNEYLLTKIGVDTAENEPSKFSSSIPTQAISFNVYNHRSEMRGVYGSVRGHVSADIVCLSFIESSRLALNNHDGS